MVMAVRIRRMRVSDLKALATIERRITGSRRTSALQGHLRRQLRAGGGVCLVADVAGKPAGVLVGEVAPWGVGGECGEEREVAWVKVVGVDPRHQGLGLGHLLGQAFLKKVRARGIRRVKTLVEGDAGELVACFPALG